MLMIFFVLDEEGLEKRLHGEFFLSELAISKDFPKKLMVEFKGQYIPLDFSPTHCPNCCAEDRKWCWFSGLLPQR